MTHLAPLLGTDPLVQGKGVGGQLLQPALDRADADGVPCYLETQKERNLSFGEKKMLETVRQLLVSEISHAVGMEEVDARSMVDRTIAKA